jgi:hypothetical protein
MVEDENVVHGVSEERILRPTIRVEVEEAMII